MGEAVRTRILSLGTFLLATKQARRGLHFFAYEYAYSLCRHPLLLPHDGRQPRVTESHYPFWKYAGNVASRRTFRRRRCRLNV